MSSHKQKIEDGIKLHTIYAKKMKENAKKLLNLIKQHPNSIERKDKSTHILFVSYCRDFHP